MNKRCVRTGVIRQQAVNQLADQIFDFIQFAAADAHRVRVGLHGESLCPVDVSRIAMEGK